MTITVHKKSKSLVIPIGFKDFISDLPHKIIEDGGKQFVAVRHTEAATLALRSAGIEVPSPVLTYHTIPLVAGRFQPFQHQLKTIEFFTLYKRCICLNTMGMGKTASALMAADYLMLQGLVKRVLILSPLSTLECVWANEIFHTTPHRTYAVIHGTAAKRREKLAYKTDYVILNHDGLGVVFDEILRDGTIDLVIVDEASVYRNASSERYKKLKSVLTPKRKLWLLTGSPTPNAPTDAWGLARLLNDNCPKYFGQFRQLTMAQVSPFKWVARKGSEQIVRKYLTPAILYRKQDCLDLPPQVFENREAALSPEQDKLFKTFRAKMEAEHDGEKLSAVNAAAKFGVLRQILGGCYKVDEDQYKQIECQPRLAATLEAVEEAENKVLIFVPYSGMLHMVANHIGKHYSVKIIEGNTDKHERDEIIKDFQTTDSTKVIVAAPRCLSHGVTLTAADTVVWYIPHVSSDEYAQANARVDRPGQKSTTTVVHIGSHQFEWKLYEALKDRLDMQKVILDLYNEIV